VERGELFWFSPDPRGLLPLDERFHVPRRLARTIRTGRFHCTVDSCFEQVVQLCARRGDDSPTWISPEIEVAYARCHQLGLAHSVEAWPAECESGQAPAGGLYGVAIGAAFFAESMYHSVTDAGKVALVYLINRLRDRGFLLCDMQWATDHLRRFGAFEMPRIRYLSLLAKALGCHRRFV